MKNKEVYTADFLRAQSRRMDALVKEMEELEKKNRFEKRK